MIIGIAREDQMAMLPKLFSISVILSFEKWHPKENTVAHLKSNSLALTNFLALPKFWAGYATDYDEQITEGSCSGVGIITCATPSDFSVYLVNFCKACV